MSRESSARTRLVQVTAKRARTWSWFCGYCAAQPVDGPRPSPLTRVCERCRLGLLLESPASAAPRPDEPYFVIDRELMVRAVSRCAERQLGLREPELVGQPIDELVPMSAQRGRLELSLRRAAAGDDKIRHAAIRLGSGFERRRARITCCGPPAAALVVLEEWLEPAKTAKQGSDR